MPTLDIGGQKIQVGDAFLQMAPEQQNAAVEEIASSLKIAPSVGEDVAKSAGIGFIKGNIGLSNLTPLGGPVGNLVTQGMKLAGQAPASGGPLPSDQIQSGIEAATGKLYQPQTRAGRYAEKIGEFLPGSVAGGGSIPAAAVKYGVIPAVTSQAAGEAAGDKYGKAAEIVGALGGIGLGAAGGRIAGGVQNYFGARTAGNEIAAALGQAPGSIPTGAVRRLEQSARADNLTPQGAAVTAAELGPEAMLLDTGRQMRGRAEAIAAQPGAGQNHILDAVEGRTGRFGAGTAQRVEQTLTQEMGQSHNVVDLQNRVDDVVNRAARPLYQQVMERHPVVWDQTLAKLTERPVIAQALEDARSLARNYGETLDNTAQPSLRAWDYAKKAMDARINGMMRTGGIQDLNSAQKADLGGLQDARRALVNHLDTVTNGEYQNARRVMATKYDLREAMETGRSAFNTKLLPEEFAAILTDMGVPERVMAQAGFRRELDRMIEATRNEGATARRLLDTNQVLQKTEMLFGQQAAREIERRIGTENTFQEATQEIARNSRTALRQQAIADTATPSTQGALATSLTGVAHAAGRGGLNYIREQGMTRTRDAMGNILAARGQQIDPIVQAITEYSRRRAGSTRQSGNAGAATIIEALRGVSGY